MPWTGIDPLQSRLYHTLPMRSKNTSSGSRRSLSMILERSPMFALVRLSLLCVRLF